MNTLISTKILILSNLYYNTEFFILICYFYPFLHRHRREFMIHRRIPPFETLKTLYYYDLTKGNPLPA